MNQIESSFDDQESSPSIYQAVLAAIIGTDSASHKTTTDATSDASILPSVSTESYERTTESGLDERSTISVDALRSGTSSDEER